jgi:hypothetical protein
LEIDVNPLDFLLGNPSGRDAGNIARQRLNARAAVPKSGGGVPRVPITSAATGTSRLLGPIATLADIYHQGSKVFNPKDNIITSIQNLSTSIGNQFAKPGQEGRYVGSNPIAVRANRELDFRNRSYYGPAYASAEALGLGTPGPSLRDYGPGYKERELAAGAAAEQFRPGAGFPGQQGAADRAYQQKLSRTAQLTAQDPELLRYEAARSAAKTQEEMNSVRDMGLAMWQERYGKTAMGKPGGAIGSFNPLMQSTFGYQTGMSPSDIAQTITNPAAVPVGPGEAPYQTGDLGTRALAETGYDPAAFGVDVEEIKKRLLQQAAAK